MLTIFDSQVLNVSATLVALAMVGGMAWYFIKALNSPLNRSPASAYPHSQPVASASKSSNTVSVKQAQSSATARPLSSAMPLDSHPDSIPNAMVMAGVVGAAGAVGGMAMSLLNSESSDPLQPQPAARPMIAGVAPQFATDARYVSQAQQDEAMALSPAEPPVATVTEPAYSASSDRSMDQSSNINSTDDDVWDDN